MTIAGRILDFAANHSGSFSRRELMESFASDTNGVSEASAHVGLTRLLNEHKIVRVGYGRYQLADNSKLEFVYPLDKELVHLYQQLKVGFPFVDVCIWRSSVFTPFMQHVPALDIVFVDVEREVMEDVFLHLQSLELDCRVMLNPSREECERYITLSRCLIVRPLIKEAPLQETGNCCAPTLEKLLVDATGDKELEYLRGIELHHIYSNAFSRYNINERRLLRYASRRHRRDRVQDILNDIQS